MKAQARTAAFWLLTFAAFAFIALTAWLNVMLAPIGRL